MALTWLGTVMLKSSSVCLSVVITLFVLEPDVFINSESLYTNGRTMALTAVLQRHRQPACIVHVWQVGLLPGAALGGGLWNTSHIFSPSPCSPADMHFSLWIGGVTSPSSKYSRCLIADFCWKDNPILHPDHSSEPVYPGLPSRFNTHSRSCSNLTDISLKLLINDRHRLWSPNTHKEQEPRE